MMSSFLPYVILSCMLYKTVVTQVSVSANKYPTHGATITLTCNITSFSLPSSWINDTSSGILSTCRSTGTCSPTTSGRYSYSATNSTIVAQISAFDASSDDFGWKCLHDTDTHVFKFTFTTTTISSPTNNSTSSTPTMTSGLTGGQIAGIVCGCIGFLIVCCLVGWRICKCTVMKDKTKNSGSSSAVSREQVQVQMEKNEERPPAVHTETQNKVDPNTRSKQTNDRQQPVPPANTGFKDIPTFRPLPTPPQNGEIKDRNVRGISATIGDTPDLSNETPRPKKLPPLTAKQEIVQEVDASEEPKRKRKKKKKKDQMNVETPEEENGETDMRVN